MAPTEKAKILYEQLVTDMTYVSLQDEDTKHLNIEPLRIYKDLVLCLTGDDLNHIKQNNIFFSAAFSPASIATIKINLPPGARVIMFDHNTLLKLEKRERLAILLHELGHAFNPKLKGEEGEFAADDFAIAKGYGIALKSSLEKNITENPTEFDKDITRKRIARITN